MDNPNETMKKSAARPAATVTYGPTKASLVGSDRYEPLKFHARGGMGEIWLAKDRGIGREVAVKHLHKKDEEHQQRFLAEAQITGQLEHPGIAPVYDLGTDQDSQNYYVMKFVQGRTLEEVIDDFHSDCTPDNLEGSVEWRRLLESFIDLCEAVAYAHSRGVIHRDIKPDNVMLGSFGETLLLDWGLAKVVGQPELPGLSSGVATNSGRSSATQLGSVLGTPAYMSPEMAAGYGAEVGPAADIYLLGGTLYKILTGRAPRSGSSYERMVELARTVLPDAPRLVNKGIPKSLQAVCLKALSKRPEDRYATAQEVADEVRRYLAGEPVEAYPDPLPTRVWRWCKAHRRGLSWSTAAVLVLGTVLFGGAKFRQMEHDRQLVLKRNQRLVAQNRARNEVNELLQTIDEAMFRIGYDAPGQRFPYYDPIEGHVYAQRAVEMSQKWGNDLEALPLVDERERLKKELYDLRLLKVQLASKRAHTDAQRREMLKELEQVSALCEPTRGVYRLRAECYRALGNEAEAAKNDQRAQDVDTPASALDHFLLGELHRTVPIVDANADPLALLQKHDLDAAIDEYREALQLDPNHYWSRLQLARCYVGLNRSAEATQAFGACIALRPNVPWAYSDRGLALARRKRFDEALDDLNRVLRSDPGFHPARINRGWVYWQKGDHGKAVQDLKTVLAPDDKDRLVHAAYYLGHLYYKQGELVQAMKCLQDFRKEHTSFKPVYHNMATVHFQLGQDVEAMESLNRFIELGSEGQYDQSDAEASYQRGRILRNLATGPFDVLVAQAENAMRDHQLAWKANADLNELPDPIKSILSKVPDQRDKEERARLAEFLRQNDAEFVKTERNAQKVKADRTRILNLAQAELKQAEQGWQSVDLYHEMGTVLEKLGRIQEAIEVYTRGLTLQPDSLKLLNKRGYNFWKSGQLDRSRDDYARATSAKPERLREEVLLAEAHVWLGILLTHKDDRRAELQAAQTLLALRGLKQSEKEVYTVLHNIACIYGGLSETAERNRSDLQRVTIDLLKESLQWAKRFGEEAIEIQNIVREEEEYFGPMLRATTEFQDLIAPRTNPPTQAR